LRGPLPCRSRGVARSTPGPWRAKYERHAANARDPGRPGRSGYLAHVLLGLLRVRQLRLTHVHRLAEDEGWALRSYFASPEYERWLAQAYEASR
jgi:hypothetical protein